MEKREDKKRFPNITQYTQNNTEPSSFNLVISASSSTSQVLIFVLPHIKTDILRGNHIQINSQDTNSPVNSLMEFVCQVWCHLNGCVLTQPSLVMHRMMVLYRVMIHDLLNSFYMG